MNNASLTVCSKCGSVNGIPESKSSTAARCGKCRQALLPAAPMDVEELTFSKTISRTTFPVVVDFWAPWCGPCKMMAPQFAAAAAGHHGQVIYLKLNTEMYPQTAAMYNIRSIPTMAIFKNGRELTRTSGAMDAGRIRQWVSEALGIKS